MALLAFTIVVAIGSDVLASQNEQTPVLLTIVNSQTGLPDAEIEPGDQITMRIIVENSSDVAGLEFKIPFDNSLLEIVEVNTIIIYEDPKRHDLVTHRVVKVNSDGSYVTKGDANGTNDRTAIPASYVRGVGQWVVPYVGLPRVWFAEGRWLLLTTVIAVAALVLWTVRYAVDARFDPWRIERARLERG